MNNEEKILQMLEKLNETVVGLDAKIDSKVDGLRDELTGKMDAMREELRDEIHDEVDRLGDKLSGEIRANRVLIEDVEHKLKIHNEGLDLLIKAHSKPAEYATKDELEVVKSVVAEHSAAIQELKIGFTGGLK